MHRAATVTTSLAAQAAAALHPPMDDLTCMPADQTSDHDMEDSHGLDEADDCSAPAPPRALLRSAPAVPTKEGRRKQDSQDQSGINCPAAPTAADLEATQEEEEGPDTPASAEKLASVIIR